MASVYYKKDLAPTNLVVLSLLEEGVEVARNERVLGEVVLDRQPGVSGEEVGLEQVVLVRDVLDVLGLEGLKNLVGRNLGFDAQLLSKLVCVVRRILRQEQERRPDESTWKYPLCFDTPCRVVLEPDSQSGSTYLLTVSGNWIQQLVAYISCVHWTSACQSLLVIRRRMNSFTLLSAYFSTSHSLTNLVILKAVLSLRCNSRKNCN